MYKPLTYIIAGLILFAVSACRQTSGTDTASGGQQLYIGDSIAIAQTKYGKVKGFMLRDIYTFCGIPYGASTAGANRFMPPREPEMWEGIRPALFWGDSAPQFTEGKYRNNEYTFTDHWNYYGVSEDCLSVNVWTPGLDDNRKRPVLFWIHGGGFTNGNSIELDSYRGENLSRYGDIVFVSVNHRLGPIGFSDFSAVDDKRFAESGNVGMLDLVAALKWVQENIAHFGGDPENVTVMGQSGGGAKVCTLIAMACTRGLIHKGVALSGNIVGAVPAAYSSSLGKYILAEAGLADKDIDKLQQMPWHDYLELAYRAAARYDAEHGGNGMMRGAFGPVGDGFHVPMDTFYSEANSPSNAIPMLFSTTSCEFSMSRTDAQLEKINKEQLIELANKMKGDKGEAIVNAYMAAFPGKKPIEILGLINSARDKVVLAADAKARQSAPVYMALFDWNPPLFDGRMRAFHCLDICFWLKNTDVMVTHTGGGKRPAELSVRMADALLNFMKTGDPNSEGLPEWPRYNPVDGATMMLGDKCEVVYDPDREARKML